ncbi:MAG: DUF3187 family protein [Rhodospirillaceae bacterium]|nr:DUF3187 family protein [Rhodospirillaceae bacterium]
MRSAVGRPRAGRRFALACALAFCILPPGAAASAEADLPGVVAPLRLVNLNPFHLLYGVPASAGARVMPEGTSELIASLDMASHLRAGASGTERVLIDGETWRHGLALRHGLGGGWELLVDVPAVSHTGGVFDGFIEDWHDAFGLPQGDRDRVPGDRLALLYADGGAARVDIDGDVHSLGDVSLGLGYALPSPPFANDGMVVRAMVKLPGGDEDALAGSGGYSVSARAETSGAFPGSAVSRRWLYSATLGVLAGEAPGALSSIGGRLIAFGRFGVTWRVLEDLDLMAQIDVHSSPYGASALSALSDAAVMPGLGGRLRITERIGLEVAVTEDDGARHAAPDIGLHAAMRWRL